LPVISFPLSLIGYYCLLIIPLWDKKAAYT
jgi:hypothetical protein